MPTGNGPFATILTYSPYFNQGGSLRSDQHWVEAKGGGRTMGPATILGSYAAFLEAGYAVALVNIRGSGLSDGCFSYIDPSDGPDANAVIAEIARQPWSDGNVGMIGISYNGWTSYAALANNPPPALKAIVPVSGTIDQWNLLGRHGAAMLLAPAHPTNRNLHQGFGLSGMRNYPAGSSMPTPHHMCVDTAEKTVAYEGIVLNGDKTPFFALRDFRARLSNPAVAVYSTHGLGVGEGHILQLEGLWDNLSTNRRLEVGQWGHHWPDEDPERFSHKIVAWFDEHLRGGPSLMPAGVVSFQDDASNWHNTTSWPPPGNTVRLRMANGLLTTDTSVAPVSQTFQSVPTDPSLARPGCERIQALYVSPPLANDVLIAGHFTVNVSLSSSLPNGNLAVFLFKTPGPGACGETRAQEVRRALSDLRHRGHLEQGRDFPVGRPDAVSILSHSYASHVSAGMRLVVAIGGGSNELLPKQQPLLTVHEAHSAATLDLTVVAGNLEFRTQ